MIGGIVDMQQIVEQATSSNLIDAARHWGGWLTASVLGIWLGFLRVASMGAKEKLTKTISDAENDLYKRLTVEIDRLHEQNEKQAAELLELHDLVIQLRAYVANLLTAMERADVSVPGDLPPPPTLPKSRRGTNG